MAESHGNKFAKDSDMIYLVGTYDTKEFALNAVNMLDLNNLGYTTISRITAAALLSGSLHLLQIACSTGSSKIEWLSLAECAIPHSIMSPAIMEPSFHFDESNNEWVIISVELFNYHNYGRRVKKCTAGNVLGPWQCAFIAEIGEERWSDENYITYAGKAHPELRVKSHFNGKQAPIVVSYVPNTRKGPSELFNEINFEAYVPKFLAIEKHKRTKQHQTR
jgi:hypothetical protein